MNTFPGQNTVPLYIVGGFLGSGKTTLINNLLKYYSGRNVGLIINEFGSISIDGEKIEPGTASVIKTELNGGQIFCSCLSGSFVDSIAAYSSRNIDVLLVEASGLAKPSPLMEIMEWGEKKSSGRIAYRGMIGIADASRYLQLSQVLAAVEEQIVFSDRIVINKCDLVREETVEQIAADIEKLSPGIWIERTSCGRISPDFMNFTHDPERISEIRKERYAGWGAQGRPKPVFLKPRTDVSSTSLRRFLEEYATRTYRIKGFCMTKDEGLVEISCSGDAVSVMKVPIRPDSRGTFSFPEPGFVLIFPSAKDSELVLQSRWLYHTGDRGKLS